MVVRKAYKFRLYPTHAQETLLKEALETCREVYNSFLHWRKYDYELFKTSPSYRDQRDALPRWKKEHPELRDVHSQVLQLCEGYIDFSKLATIKAVLHRGIPGEMKTATIRCQSGKWFVTISCIEEAEPLPESDASVGIDVGLENFATFSDDTEPIENPRFFRTDQKALAKAQRKFEKVKNWHGTPERSNAKKVVTRIHERIRNRRHNFHHQEARKIVNHYGIITVEELNIANMSKSPAPKQDEATGKYLPNGHAAKAELNKSILDAGWYSFRMIVTSKAESAGRYLYAINPAYNSQDCSKCGYRPPKEERKKLSNRRHKCPNCGYSVHRDKNSAELSDKIGMGLHAVRRRAVEAVRFIATE